MKKENLARIESQGFYVLYVLDKTCLLNGAHMQTG